MNKESPALTELRNLCVSLLLTQNHSIEKKVEHEYHTTTKTVFAEACVHNIAPSLS